MPGYYSPDGANTNPLVDNPYVSYQKNKKGVTTYNTILYPVRAGESKSIITEEIPLDVPDDMANAFNAVIQDDKSGLRQNLAYYTLFDEDGKKQRKFIEWENKTLRLSSTDMDSVDMESLKIAENGKVSSVLLNGRPVKYYRNNGFISFSENTPQDPEEKPHSGNDSSGPVHSSGSGSSYNPGGASPGGTGSGDVGPGSESSSGGTAAPSPPEVNKGTFTDTAGHWAETYIKKATEKNIIFGNGDGSFAPDAFVRRAELVAMAVRMLGMEQCDYDGTFDDVSNSDWYAELVAQALKYGIISNDIEFRPNDFITREEMCKILVETAKLYGIELDAGSQKQIFPMRMKFPNGR